jgi:predicted phosphodiesterase
MLTLEGSFYFLMKKGVNMKEQLTTEARILKEKKPMNMEEMAKIAGVGVDVISGCIDTLESQGYTFVRNGEIFVRTKMEQAGNTVDLSALFDKRYLEFGIISDTHLDSKYERLDILNLVYDEFKKEGVSVVFHAGDISEGIGVFRGQEREIKHFGQDEQIQYVSDHYPKRKDITTFFILGNHDLRQYEKGGIDIGGPIQSKRSDLSYLGPIEASVMLPNGVKMNLLHPGGGTAYALSYKSQRAINNMSPGSLPDILVYGHYHTSFYMCYRGIHFIQAPSTKDMGLWEKSLGFNSTLGGWIVDAEISTEGNHINKFKPQLLTPNI